MYLFSKNENYPISFPHYWNSLAAFYFLRWEFYYLSKLEIKDPCLLQ